MSRQINFYATKEDIDDLAIAMKSRLPEPFVIARSESADGSLCVLNGLSDFFRGIDWVFFYLARTADVGSIVIEKRNADRWVVDEMRSPVIEFTKRMSFGGSSNDHVNPLVSRGRVYLNEKYLDLNGGTVKRDQDFLLFSGSVFKLIKKEFKKNGNFYWGRRALGLSGL